MPTNTYNRRELIKAAHVLDSPADPLKVMFGGALIVGVSYLLPVLLAPAAPNIGLQLSPYLGWLVIAAGGIRLAVNELRVQATVRAWILTGNPHLAVIRQMSGRVEDIDIALDNLGTEKQRDAK